MKMKRGRLTLPEYFEHTDNRVQSHTAGKIMGVPFMRQSGNFDMPIVMMSSFILTDCDKLLYIWP